MQGDFFFLAHMSFPFVPQTATWSSFSNAWLRASNVCLPYCPPEHLLTQCSNSKVSWDTGQGKHAESENLSDRWRLLYSMLRNKDWRWLVISVLWIATRLFCWSLSIGNSTSGCVRKINRDNGFFTLLSSLSRSIWERLLFHSGWSEP